MIRQAVVAVIIQNHEGEFYVQQRPAHKLMPGMWEFPGGKVEPNGRQRADDCVGHIRGPARSAIQVHDARCWPAGKDQRRML